jgi:hypothetical protein
LELHSLERESSSSLIVEIFVLGGATLRRLIPALSWGLLKQVARIGVNMACRRSPPIRPQSFRSIRMVNGGGPFVTNCQGYLSLVKPNKRRLLSFIMYDGPVQKLTGNTGPIDLTSRQKL